MAAAAAVPVTDDVAPGPLRDALRASPHMPRARGNGRVEPAVEERQDREDLERLLFGHGSEADLRDMRRQVPKVGERPVDHQSHATVLALLAVGSEGVPSEQWRAAVLDTQRIFDELGAVGFQAGSIAQLLRDTLGRLEYGVEVVALK